MITHVLGVTGRAILEALIAGQSDPNGLVQLRRGKLKASEQELREALDGRVRDHHRFLLRLHLDQIDALEKAVRTIERRLEVVLSPFREELELLTTIPGVSTTTARILLAEIGPDMSQFSSSSHLVSWAGLCPRSDQSAGKRRSSHLRQGNTWLKTALVQSAWAAARKKDSYLRGQYYRLKARRGGKKAAVAVAASMLTAAYYILLRGVPYQDLGPAFPDRRHKEATVRRLVSRLRNLGIDVEIKSAA